MIEFSATEETTGLHAVPSDRPLLSLCRLLFISYNIRVDLGQRQVDIDLRQLQDRIRAGNNLG